MLFFIFSSLIACAGKPVRACPLEVIPPTVVLRYGDSLSVNCSSSSSQTKTMGWESPYAGVPLTAGVSSLPLRIQSLDTWELEPTCFINFGAPESQCSKSLSVTVYKVADSVSVSMSPPRQMGPIVEGKNYSMQCDVTNVAPARNLSVYWYKGNKTFHVVSFYDETKPSPVNLSSVLNLTAHRDDNGRHIWCGAKLKLGPSGPDLPLLPSKSHDVTVLYPPTFTKPEKEIVTLVAGGRIGLNCTATGNPMPSYSWQFSQIMQEKNKNQNQPVLTISYSGTYNCTVSNTQGTKTKYFIVTEAERNYTTLAALIGVFLTVAVLLFIGGYFFVTSDGSFSFRKGGYVRGQPTSSGPI